MPFNHSRSPLTHLCRRSIFFFLVRSFSLPELLNSKLTAGKHKSMTGAKKSQCDWEQQRRRLWGRAGCKPPVSNYADVQLFCRNALIQHLHSVPTRGGCAAPVVQSKIKTGRCSQCVSHRRSTSTSFNVIYRVASKSLSGWRSHPWPHLLTAAVKGVVCAAPHSRF